MWNVEILLLSIRWDRFAPQFPGTFIWSSPHLDNKIRKSPIKSHSRRSTGCCCTRTCWHVLSYFRRTCRSNISQTPMPTLLRMALWWNCPWQVLPQFKVRSNPSPFYSWQYLITEYLDVVERVKAYILSHPEVHSDKTRWIQGWGWDQTKWPIAQFPTAVRLDFTTVRMMSSYNITKGWSWPRPIAKRSADFPKPHRRTRSLGFFGCSPPNAWFAWKCRWWIDCAG